MMAELIERRKRTYDRPGSYATVEVGPEMFVRWAIKQLRD